MAAHDHSFHRLKTDIKVRLEQAIPSHFLLHGWVVGICLAGRGKLSYLGFIFQYIIRTGF